MQSELDQWSKTASQAKKELEHTKTDLQQRQDIKRRLSERLFQMLLDSEDSREQRLQHVERSLQTLTHNESEATVKGDSSHMSAQAETIAGAGGPSSGSIELEKPTPQ